MSAKARQIDSLTPLRGIAAILVVVYHTNSMLAFQQLGPILLHSSFLARGYLWVDFFFVLSGFIITHVYGDRFTDRIRLDRVREYIGARFARIYPLYFFMALVGLIFAVTVDSHLQMGGPPPNRPAMAGAHPTGSGRPPLDVVDGPSRPVPIRGASSMAVPPPGASAVAMRLGKGAPPPLPRGGTLAFQAGERPSTPSGERPSVPGGGRRMPRMGSPLDWKVLLGNALMLLGMGITPMPLNFPSWSIGAEWWTYLLALPLFPLLNRGVSARTFLIPALCCIGLFALILHGPTHTLDITFDLGLLRCFLDFTIGICAYQIYRARLWANVLETDRALLAAVLLIAALLHFPVIGAYQGGFGTPFPDLGLTIPILDTLSPIAFALLVLTAALNIGSGRRLLNLKPLRTLGDISYSTYLVQGRLLMLLLIVGGIYRSSHPTGRMKPLLMLGLILATVLVDLLIAAFTYRFVEMPAREWLRARLTGRAK